MLNGLWEDRKYTNEHGEGPYDVDEMRFDPKVGKYHHFPVNAKYCKRIAEFWEKTKREVGVWESCGDFDIRLNEDGSVDEIENKYF